MNYPVHGILQARILEWVAIPSPGDLPNLGIKPRSPTLEADSLPAEPPEKPLRIYFFHSNPMRQIWSSLPYYTTGNFKFCFFCGFFWCGSFLKSFLNVLQYCLLFLCFDFFRCFCFDLLGGAACGISAPWPGIQPTAPCTGRWNLNH